MNCTSSKTRQTPRCQICGREIKTNESISRGIGPECLAKRQTYLAAAGATVEEIESLILSDNPQASRWATVALRAIGDGNSRLVARFIAQARLEVTQ